MDMMRWLLVMWGLISCRTATTTCGFTAITMTEQQRTNTQAGKQTKGQGGKQTGRQTYLQTTETNRQTDGDRRTSDIHARVITAKKKTTPSRQYNGQI